MLRPSISISLASMKRPLFKALILSALVLSFEQDSFRSVNLFGHSLRDSSISIVNAFPRIFMLLGAFFRAAPSPILLDGVKI